MIWNPECVAAALGYRPWLQTVSACGARACVEYIYIYIGYIGFMGFIGFRVREPKLSYHNGYMYIVIYMTSPM